MKRSKRARAAEQADVYWMDRPKQIDVLASSMRNDLLDRLVALGPTSVRELASALNLRPTALYHHLKLLEDAGLITAVRTDQARGRPAQLYQAVGKQVRFAHAFYTKRSNRESVMRVTAAVARQAVKDYRASLDSGSANLDGAARDSWMYRLVSAPSPARRAEINAHFDKIAELLWAPDPEPGPLISVVWFMSPLTRTAPKSSASEESGKRGSKRPKAGRAHEGAVRTKR